MEKIKMKKIFKKINKGISYTLTFSLEPEIYPYIVFTLRGDILTLCSRSVPSSIVVTYDILSYDNGTESK